MNALRLSTVLIVSLVGLTYSLDTLPPLRWVKHVSETTINPKYVFDYSDDAFLCVDGSKMVVLSTIDGSVKKTVTGLKNNRISRSSSGGYVAVGNDTVTLINSALETVWSRRLSYGFSLVDAVQTADYGFVAIGTDVDTTVTIVRTNADLDTLWTRVVPNPIVENSGFLPPFISCLGIAETKEGYIACGTYCGEVCLWKNGWVYGYSRDGTKEWTRTFTGLDIYDMIPVEDGIVMTGELDLETEPSETVADALGKRKRFPATAISFVHVGADGNILVDQSLGSGRGKTIRKSGDAFVVTVHYIMNFAPMTEWDIILAANKNGEEMWSIEDTSNVMKLDIALPHSADALVVAARDSLYYYAPTVRTSGKNQTGAVAASKKIFSPISRNCVSFNLDKAAEVRLTLLTTDGRVLLDRNEGRLCAGQHSVNLGNPARGCYVLRLLINNRKIVQGRIVLQ